jgi:excisionase family DNA binding protein
MNWNRNNARCAAEDRGGIAMMTVKQVAERLNVSMGTVYAAIERGELKCYRFGRRSGTIRVSEEYLGEYLASSRVERQSVDTLPYRFKHLNL